MSKNKAEPVAGPPVVYPKQLLAVYSNHGDSDNEYLATGVTPNDLEGVDNPTVRVARYVLVGTGVIQHTAAQYVEHQAA